METQGNPQVKKQVPTCKVYVALPQNWKNKDNTIKRALGAIQRAHPHLAIFGVNKPSDAHAHYFLHTAETNWVLKKHQFDATKLESIPLNQGDTTELNFIEEKAKE